MGTITNIINTLFTSSGASDVVGETDRINRSQTRLGQTSASAGRQFAAQANGLGGLVGAYAGAAATVFALQAAFTALANAARAEQTFQGLNALAANVGASGESLLASVREITNSQLTLAEAASQVNLAISAGFNTTQIEGLTGVAMKASRALGRDLTDSMTRVVRGSAKMETELLDELGIYTKIEPATRAYAAAIGKSVGSLSEFERRQAFANAVIAEGERKFSSINTTIPTTAEKIEAFGAKILDLTTQLGILLADTLAPLADFLTNNVAAAFSVLGIAISLAAGKGIQVLSAGFQALTASIVTAGLNAENFVRKITGIQGTATTASTAIKTLTADMLRLNDAEKARFAAIQSTAATRNLSKSEIKESNALINKSITAINAERTAEEARRNTAMAALNASRGNLDVKRADFEAAKTNLRTLQQQGANTAALTAAQSQLASAQGRLGAATAAFNGVQANNIAVVTSSRAAILGLNADVARLNATLASTIPAATGARAAIAGFLALSTRAVASVAAGFSGLFTGIVGAASKLFFVTSIITLIGSSFANAIGKGEEFEALLNKVGQVFKGIFTNADAKKAKNAIQGLTAANLSELEKTDNALRNTDSFTFKSKILGFEVDITKTKEELASEVTSLLGQASQGFEKTIADAATSGKAIGGALGGNILGPLLRFIPLIGPIIGPLLGRTIGTAIGAGLGTIWDYFTEIPELPPELTAKIRSQFADSLVGLDVEVQDKLVNVLGSLEQKYGAAARFDPAARAALKTQQQLVLEGGKYLDDIEAISELMIATGQTADKLVKNFNFDKGERQISYISQAFTELAGRSFTFNFVDIQDEQLQNLIKADYNIDIPVTLNTQNIDSALLSDLEATLPSFYIDSENISTALEQTKNSMLQSFPARAAEVESLISAIQKLPEAEQIILAGGIAFDNLKEPIEEAVGAYNSYQQSSIRALEVQRQLYDSLQDGTATLESFTQGLSNSKSAVIEAERGYYATAQQITVLEKKLIELRKVNPQLADGLEQFISQLKIGQMQTEDNLAAQKDITKELAAQEAILKNQLTLSNFFKSFKKDAKNPITLQLEFATAGSENPLAVQVGYLSQFVTATKAEIAKYNALDKALEPLSLTDAEKQKILTTPLEDAQQLADELNDASKLFRAVVTNEGIVLTTNLGKYASQATAKLNLLAGTGGKITETTLAATEAINEIIRQAAENLPQFIDEKTKQINTLVDNSVKEIQAIAREEIVLGLKFESNIEQIRRDISLLKQEAIIEQLELDIDLTKAKVDAGAITEVQGASEETRLRQQILQEEQYLIGEQFVNESMAIEARRTIMEAESQAREVAIRTEALAQAQKLQQDRAYVTGVAAMYDAAIAGLDSSADRQVTGIIQAGNSVSDTWAQTLKTGATALNSAIVQGLAESTQFANNVAGGTAEPVDLGKSAVDSVKNAAKGFADSTTTAIEAVGASTRAQIEAERTARERAGQLLDAEQEAALANYEARIAAAVKAGDIEAYNAIAREKKAAEAGGKDEEKLNYIQEKLKQLFDSIKGNIENALMGINDLIFYGEGNIGDIMGNLFKSIQQDFFKTTVADPLSGFLTDNLFSMLGVEGMRTGIENAQVKNGALLVSVVSGPADLFGVVADAVPGTKESIKDGKLSADSLTESTKGIFGGFFDQITSLFTNIFGQNGILSGLFKNLMGEGGILSGLFKGIGGLFGGIFSFFGASQGGLVHLAAGGAAASASLNRDRVPAMLEPGEFVIRKQSAEKIGMPALQAMNATGGAGGNGNVFVNVTNEGSPKQADASAPRFDGEKYVVDIVMRDIANNGPIRRTLRGRGGL